MIYFIFGKDTFRSWQKVLRIINQYFKKNPSSLNYKVFEEENLNFLDFKLYVVSQSMFPKKKLILVKEASKNKQFVEDFLKAEKSFLKTEDAVIIFYEKEKINKNSAFFKYLLKVAEKFEEFDLLDKEKLRLWIEKEVSRYNFKITPEAIDAMISYFSNDLWQISSTISKIIAFKKEKEKIIEKEDVEAFFPFKEEGLFSLFETFFQKRKDAIFLFQKEIEKGTPPSLILFYLWINTKLLLILKEMIERKTPYYLIKKTFFSLEIPSQKSEYILCKNLELAKKISLAELKNLYQKISHLDIIIKSGKGDPENNLFLLFLQS
jgi:DNA polymerase III delta subunit